MFGDVRTRELGLDPIKMRNGLSSPSLKALKDFWENQEHRPIDDVEFEKKLDDLLKDINDYSKNKCCGLYSLLSLLNCKYQDGSKKNISKEDLFGEIFIQTALSSKGRDIYNYNKLINLMKVVKDREAPINVKEMENICDYLNKNKEKYKEKYGYKQIKYDVIPTDKNGEKYKNPNNGNSFSGSEADLLLKDKLNKGGSAIVMLKEGDDPNFTVVIPDEGSDVDSHIRDKWATTKHYVTLTGKNVKSGKIRIIDSRDFNPSSVAEEHYDHKNVELANNKNVLSSGKMNFSSKKIDNDIHFKYDYDDWSNLREAKYSNLKKHVQNDTKSFKEKTTGTAGGIILFE